MNFRTSLLLSVLAKGISSMLTIYVVYMRQLDPEFNPFTSPAAQAWGMAFVALFYALLAAWRWVYDRRVKAGFEVRWKKAADLAYAGGSVRLSNPLLGRRHQ